MAKVDTEQNRLTQDRWTESDLLRLPRDGRKYELVEGRIRIVPTGGRHGRIGAHLTGIVARQSLHPFYDSSTGFRMAGGNIRSPDLSVMRRQRLPEGKTPIGFIDGAPDLAIEIISPDEREADIRAKLHDYFTSGAQEVWLLYPERREVWRYRSMDAVEVLGAEDTLTGGDLLPDFAVRVAELFEVD